MKVSALGIILALTGTGAALADPALTIYNQNFGVVRDIVHLNLKAGVNHITYNDATMHLEPDSVVLRDPTGRHDLQILEQNFRAEPLSQGLLLNYYEGKTIEFESNPRWNGAAQKEIIRGKIIRSGYVPHTTAYGQYGQSYAMAQQDYSSPMNGAGQPIIEVDGKLIFQLPGEPLFPALPDDSILKPTLTWEIQSDKKGSFDAELGYVTGGMNWHADYNLVAPENSETMELVGWITMDNETGKSFPNAKIKLMAGDVNKIRNNPFIGAYSGSAFQDNLTTRAPVSEKAFDDYHLYTLDRPATLLDRETKQVEFVHAKGIQSHVLYIYDGLKIDQRFAGWGWESIFNNREYGTDSSTKVEVMREFFNAATNHLGLPLPQGRLRFYRQDADGQLEFTGENNIDHTPQNEKIRVATGNAFDLVGERKRTDFKQQQSDPRWVEESFEINLRNHKKQPVEIRVVEHLYRGSQWEIKAHSEDFTKTDAQTIEYRVMVDPEVEKTISYTVHYSW
jgi:hypothetical protein